MVIVLQIQLALCKSSNIKVAVNMLLNTNLKKKRGKVVQYMQFLIVTLPKTKVAYKGSNIQGSSE